MDKSEINRLLEGLSMHYSPEKTEDDYRKILQSMTSNNVLIDKAMKIWEKSLNELESTE